jgi:WD40 repeat protein
MIGEDTDNATIFRCPFNCIAFHPELETVVTGGWDATLKIWDVYFKGGNPKKGVRFL